MSRSDTPGTGSRSYTLMNRKRDIALRVCGGIDLVASFVLLVLGLALVAVGTWQGAAILVAVPIFVWAGTVMTWSRVYLTPDRLSTMTARPHRARREEIASIDVRRIDFGKIPRVLPVVRLKDGRSFKLLPLAASAVVGYSRQSDEEQTRARRRQAAMVEEIRASLGVGGTDDLGQ